MEFIQSTEPNSLTCDSKYRYRVITEFTYSEEEGGHLTYGIVVELKHKNEWIEVGAISDLDTDAKRVRAMAKDFTRDQVLPIRFVDILNDRLGAL